MKNKITVVGSINTDLVIQTTKFPMPGETVIGGEFNTYQGGKGANQATAAARLGGQVSFIARVGDGDLGKRALDSLTNDNIQMDFVGITPGIKTGVAVITVDDTGQNAIVVSPGANKELKVRDILNALDEIMSSYVVLIQLEIPLQTVETVLEITREAGIKTILNPAPATQLSNDVLKDLYLITPNETEASILSGIHVVDEVTAKSAADLLLERGIRNVIVTLGGKGALFVNKDESFLIEAEEVDVLDTTAAGDVFNGAIATALAEDMNWRDAISFANRAAAISVGRMGAQSSIPYRNEI